MSVRAGVIAVTSLALEARIAQGPGVSVVLCNEAHHLAARLGSAVARGASGIISFGIAGALAPHLVAGDCIIASAVRYGDGAFATDRSWAQRLLGAIPEAIHAEVVGSDTILAHPTQKAQAHARTRAIAVDMESHIAASVAHAHRIPFAVCRIVIDAAHRTLPPAAAVGLRPDGAPDVLAVMRSVLKKPSQVPDLIRTAIDARIAENALRRVRRQLGEGLGIAAGDDVALELAVA